MAKKKAPSPPAPQSVEPAKELEKFFNAIVQNGLGEALGFPGSNPLSIQGVPWTETISNINTIFKNLRYYFVSNFRQVLSQAYVEIGLIQTLVDVPVDDALRGGVEVVSLQLSEEEIKELVIALDRDNDVGKVGQTAKWNRLFGGAGHVILTGQEPNTPLSLRNLFEGDDLDFYSADLWELYWDQQNVEGFDPVQDMEEAEYYSFYGEEFHKSRVIALKGLTAPSFVRPRLRGWGFSIVEMLVRSINQYLKSTDLTFEVLDEFKLDVYKIKNLVNTLLSPNGKQKVTERVQMANWQKNYQNAVVMDSEDDFDHKQLSFAGLADAQQGIRMQVAADMRFPMIKLFGTPASGLGADDEESLEVYNSMVESSVREKIKPVLRKVIELKCQVLFGFIPDDIEIKFKPLRVLSAKDEEEVKTQKFTRLLQAKQAGEITTLEFREGCNRDNLLGVQLDTKSEELNPDELEKVEEADNAESKETENA